MPILATIEDTPASREIITTAHELASGLEHELIVLHAITENEFNTRQDNIPNYTLEQANTDAATVAEGHVLDVNDGEDVDIRGTVGDPAQEILAASRDLDADYLVIGGRKRTPVGKALFGSVTQSILLGAECPVVTVMAED